MSNTRINTRRVHPSDCAWHILKRSGFKPHLGGTHGRAYFSRTGAVQIEKYAGGEK
jgi:hypothetical protein